MAAPPVSNVSTLFLASLVPFCRTVSNGHCVDELEAVLVCVSFHNKVPQTTQYKYQAVIFSLFRTLSLRQSCGQACFLLRPPSCFLLSPHSLAHRWCLLGVSSCSLFFVCICVLVSSCANVSWVRVHSNTDTLSNDPLSNVVVH